MPAKSKAPRRMRRQMEQNAPVGILQVMPGRRVRLDPSIVTELAAFVFACRVEYERQVRMSTRGLDSEERARRFAQVRWARMMVGAHDKLLERILGTVDLDDVNKARADWLAEQPDNT